MFSDQGTGSVPEQLHVVRDEQSGLDCVIALHSTALGPAAGGCRLWSYTDADALTADACRLAEGMSYKNALAGLPFGGGKAVIRQPAGHQSRADLFAAFGRAVQLLGGLYVTAEDVGTSVTDMGYVAETTRFVAGLPQQSGMVGGDPSPWTARGVYLAMREAVGRRLNKDLSECTVAIQGVGHVGSELARLLATSGARLVVADIDSVAVARLAVETGAQIAAADAIATVKADVFAPCALGGVINSRSVGKLGAKVVCGAANNQLLEPDDADRLAERNILYAPDFVVNAGGIINVGAEYLHWTPQAAQALVDATPVRLARVLDLAETEGRSTHMAAVTLAQQIIAAGPVQGRAAA